MKRTWLIILLVILLLCGGYGAAKYRQYSREWQAFDHAWQNITVDLSGTYSCNWRPGLFSAVGEMDLSDCQVTDEQLAKLNGLTTLVKLNLSNNDLTDDGLNHLTDLTNLRELDLRGTQVTDQGVLQLEQALPKCEVSY